MTSTDGASRTKERMEWATGVGDDAAGGTVTLTLETVGDGGLGTHDSETVEIEVPDRGVLNIGLESAEVTLVPNSVDGNPCKVVTDDEPGESHS